MDREKLDQELIAFCEACKNAKKPISIEGTSEAYPGLSDTSITIHIKALDWADNLVCAQILDELYPIFWEYTTEMSRRGIFALNVYNKKETMNCHHPMTYKVFEEAAC